MKQVLLCGLAGILAYSGAVAPSVAQTMYDCQSVAKPADRLACYDKLSPPVGPKSKRASQPTSTELDKEDARMKQLLKPICRNC